MKARWGDNSGATAVLEHGANPGLVSHFTKQALLEIATAMLQRGLVADPADVPMLEGALATASNDRTGFNVLAMLTGTKVIHIAERDTQITNVPKETNEFVNTWSVDGFYEEGIAPAEMGWGTHEIRLPPDAYVHTGEGPRNQICLARPGMETWVRSWVPSGEIRGMVVRHGEAFTMCEHLTVDDPLTGAAVYRPTVHYAYHPSDAAINSVLELRMRNWEMQPKQRILNDEIISGRDELGVLLMGHPFKAWWTGSVLSIDEARAIAPPPERHHLAGGRLDRVGRRVDDRPSARGRVRARRPAVGRRARGREALPRHPVLRARRLGSGQQPQRRVPRLEHRARRPEHRRPLAVHQLPHPLTPNALGRVVPCQRTTSGS